MNTDHNKRKIILFISWLLTACCPNSSPPTYPLENTEVTIPETLGNNVVLATGIDFETGKSIAINPKTGEEKKPCKIQQPIYTKNNDFKRNYSNKIKEESANKSLQEDCNIALVNPNQELLNSFEYSQKILNGTILKDGEPVPARFIVTLSALYEGSNCITIITNGGQYQSCITLEEDCTWLLQPLTHYANNMPMIKRMNVRKACGEIPLNPDINKIPAVLPQWKKDWRIKDCNNLRPVYKRSPAIPAKDFEPAINYPIGYQRYIWKTCKDLAPSVWGSSP